MPDEYDVRKANPVDIARNTLGTPTAKLIAILVAHGITNNTDIAEIIGIQDRAVRKARNSGTGTEGPAGTTGPELQDRSGTTVPETELQDRNSGTEPSCAGANMESSTKISFTKKEEELTNTREADVGQSELKQAFNGSTENIISDVLGWMGPLAERKNATKWLTTTLSLNGKDAVMAAYQQILQAQASGDLISDPIRYFAKTAANIKITPRKADTSAKPSAAQATGGLAGALAARRAARAAEVTNVPS